MSQEKEMDLILSQFDAELFLNEEYNEANETERVLMPQGWLPACRIVDLDIIRPRLLRDNEGKDFWTSPQLHPTFVIDDEGTRELLNTREGVELKFRPRIFLDLAPDTGGLDFGANRNLILGQLREAMGQNVPGQPWSVANLRDGPPVNILVKHRAMKNNPDIIMEEVSRFAAVDSEE